MRDEFQLPDSAPGHYFPLREDRSLSKAYFPDKLPPHLDLSEAVVAELAGAMHALGRLDGLGSEVDNPGAVFSSFVYKEAEQSSQVEGTAVTVSDIYRLELDELDAGGVEEPDEHERDVREARNYIRALEEAREYFAVAGRSRENVTVELVKSMHETLMERGRTGEADPLPGEFRPELAAIMETNDLGQKQVRFVPPPPDAVGGKMTALVEFVQSGSKWPDLVDVALVHYQFGTVHPFVDGNGRIGRLLIVVLLLCSDLLVNPLLYPSSYFKRRRDEYADRLLAVSEAGEWEEWLLFFLDGIRRQAEEAFVRAKLLLRKRREYVDTYEDAPKSVRRLVPTLFAEPYFTISRAADLLDMSYQGAAEAVERLVADTVLAEITGDQTNRVFRAEDVMEIVEQPAEPLPSPGEVIEADSGW